MKKRDLKVRLTTAALSAAMVGSAGLSTPAVAYADDEDL